MSGTLTSILLAVAGAVMVVYAALDELALYRETKVVHREDTAISDAAPNRDILE